MNDLHINYDDIVAYVNSASDLAEALKRDIQRDGKVSTGTIVFLNTFIIAATSLDDLTKQAALDYSESN